MAGQTIAGISQQLRSGEDTLSALEAIEQLETLDERVTRDLIDDLAYALENETNSYSILQLLKQLRRIAESQPQIAARATETVARSVNDALEDFDGGDPSENRRIQWGSEILHKILDGTESVNESIDVKFSEIKAFTRHGAPSHRAIGYRLIGRMASGEAVRILLRDFSHEVKDVRDARDAGLREARELTMASIDGRGPVNHVDAIDSFTELYKADLVSPEAVEFAVVRESIHELIERINENQREQLLSAVERLTREDPTEAEDLVASCLDRIKQTDGPSSRDWDLLRACAAGSPTVVLTYADEIAKRLERAEERETLGILRVVKEAAKRSSSVPAVLAEPVVRLLESDNRETAVQAIKTVAVMGFYPPPEPLVELKSHNRASLSDAAARAADQLNRRDTAPEFVYDLAAGEATLGLFSGDEDDVYLKIREEGGQWTDLNLGSLREGIVRKVLVLLERGENVPLVYPYYEPKDVVVLTLAVFLQHAEADPQVGLYSPGSQTQWGMKSEIREELARFGLSDVPGEVISASPIPEVITESYVSEGTLKDKHEGQGLGRLVLTKRVSELEEVPSLDKLVLNIAARARVDLEEDVRDLEASHPEAELVSAYSCYTRNESEGRPRYGPPTGLEAAQTVPGADLLGAAIERSKSTDHGITGSGEVSEDFYTEQSETSSTRENLEWRLGDDEVRAWSQPARIRVRHVEDESLTELFDQLFEESASLRHTEDAGASNLIFSRQMFFERLPIPPEDYDEWVRERYAEGDVYVPPLTEERLDDIERKAGVVDNLEAVQPLKTSKRILERVRDRLQQRNPLFEALKERVSRAKADGDRLAIFAESPKNAQLLREVLRDRGILNGEGDDHDAKIGILSPNDARGMGVYDEMVIFGSLHPEHAGYYVHPRVGETVVMTYDVTWADMIERHATEFVQLLNETVAGPDYSPFEEPEIVGDAPTEEIEEGSEDPASPAQSPAVTTGDDRSKAELLADAMRSYSANEYATDADRYERELQHYVIETEHGEQLTLTNQESVLRQGTTLGRDVEWVNPEELSVGDTIVTLPDEVERELWQNHLKKLYEGAEGLEGATEKLQIWYDAVEDIWERVETELVDDEEGGRVDISKLIHGWIDEEVEDFDRSPSTVRQWFSSVQQADDPMELTQDPTLTIGPRSYEDIEAIGAAFGYEKLEKQASEVEKVMRGIRNVNRREGHEYRDHLREQINADDETVVSKSASYHEIAQIERRESESSDDGGGSSQSHATDNILRTRAVDLVELAPTKNSVLADEWGYESGAELYQFLSSEFSDYYRRNNDKMIVPTDKARRVARETREGD